MTGFASLIKGLDPKQDPPQGLLDLLGSTLRSRMERFDLWEKVPKVLGYDQFAHWSEPTAFAVLLGDCYEVCIQKRLSQLQQSDERNGKLDQRLTAHVDVFLVNFTTLVRQLEPGVEPSLGVIQQLWELLEQAVRRQLRKSNFWHQSPLKLGVFAGKGGWRDDEAMTELINEAYGRCIAGQLDRLKGLIAIGNSIDGRVCLALQHLIYDRWRRHSRHEYTLFKNPEAVVRRMEEAGQIFVSPERRGKKGKIILKPASLVSFAVTVTEQPVASRDSLREALRCDPQWVADIKQLVGQKHAREIIEAGIYRIRHFGITCFRFGDLQGVLRSEYEREVGIPQFEEIPDAMSDKWEPGELDVLWDTKAVHREIDQSRYQVKVKQLLHEIETLQYEAVVAGKLPPGPTKLAKVLVIPKQTASDYVIRLQVIRREVHLD